MTSPACRDAAEIGRTALGPRTLPALSVQPPPTIPEHVDTALRNGLRVIAVRKPTVPLVELRLRVPFAGSDRLHPARSGVLARTLLSGTADRDRVTVDVDLALHGAELNVSVDQQWLTVQGRTLSDGLPNVLEVLADALLQASYPDTEVAAERDQLSERLSLARTRPGTIAREAVLNRRYGEHRAAREMPAARDVATVAADDVRALHSSSVLAKGSTLVLVGDVDPGLAVAEVETALHGWTSTASAARMGPVPRVPPGELELVPRAGSVQSQIRLTAQAAPRTDPRYPALLLANLAYGGYFSSRLSENIREDKGYTYGARSVVELIGDSAALLISADTASEVTAPALLETRYELGRICLSPPRAPEVESVRRFATGLQLIDTASQSGLASQLDEIAGDGLDLAWLAEFPQRVAALGPDDVAAAAEEFFTPGNFTGVVVGDAERLAPQLRALGDVCVAER